MSEKRWQISGIDHVQLAAPAGCEAEARRFYGELLGLAEVSKPATLAGRGGVWFQAGFCTAGCKNPQQNRKKYIPPGGSIAHHALTAQLLNHLARIARKISSYLPVSR